MVKYIFIGFCLFFVSCNYLLLPHKYFNDYSKIIGSKNTDTVTSLNFIKAYVVEDTFLSRFYSIRERKNIKSYIYEFYYRNNLEANIRTPIIIKGVVYPFYEKELSDSIKNGFFDKSENQNKITWSYFETRNNKLIKYGFDYNLGSGANILTHTHTTESIFLILNGGIIHESYVEKNINTQSFKYLLALPSEVNIKPDSSKSDFIKMYHKYLTEGKRRYYPYYPDFEKYINKKQTH